MKDFVFSSCPSFHFVGFAPNWEEVTEVAVCQTGLGKPESQSFPAFFKSF